MRANTQPALPSLVRTRYQSSICDFGGGEDGTSCGAGALFESSTQFMGSSGGGGVGGGASRDSFFGFLRGGGGGGLRTWKAAGGCPADLGDSWCASTSTVIVS